MPHTRIDCLRELLATVGNQQVTYWKFFNPFSGRLEKEFGEYLGDPTCVALSCAEGDFSFDQGGYKQSGIGFKNGKFVIPLMVRLRNLKDKGETLIRIHPLFTLGDDELTIELAGQPPLSTSLTNIGPLLEYIYQYLTSSCGKNTWFAENPSHYQGTGIGFAVRERVT